MAGRPFTLTSKRSVRLRLTAHSCCDSPHVKYRPFEAGEHVRGRQSLLGYVTSPAPVRTSADRLTCASRPPVRGLEDVADLPIGREPPPRANKSIRRFVSERPPLSGLTALATDQMDQARHRNTTKRKRGDLVQFESNSRVAADAGSLPSDKTRLQTKIYTTGRRLAAPPGSKARIPLETLAPSPAASVGGKICDASSSQLISELFRLA